VAGIRGETRGVDASAAGVEEGAKLPVMLVETGEVVNL
jgi:hypothetical protein